MWEGCSGEPTQGEPYTGTKPETVDTDKGMHLQAAAATPYPISHGGMVGTLRWCSGGPRSIYKAIGVKRAQPTLTRWLKRTEERIVGL